MKSFCKSLTREGLSSVVGTADSITSTIKREFHSFEATLILFYQNFSRLLEDFHTAVGNNVQMASTQQKEAAIHAQSKRKPKGCPFVCKAPEVGNSGQVYSATVPRRAKAIPPLQPMSTSNLFLFPFVVH